MRAVRIEEFGGPKVLVPVDVPDPVPGPGQVLVRVAAAGVNRADEVFETSVSRHLFPDSCGRRHGRPHVGRWWDDTRIPGRARSHTTARKWETFRLHGTLAGHLNTYRHRGLAPTVTTPEQAAALPPDVRVLEQPGRMPAPSRPAGRA
jgi:hypothetical protein